MITQGQIMLLSLLLVMTIFALIFIAYSVIQYGHTLKLMILPLLILPIFTFIFYLGWGNYAGTILKIEANEYSPVTLIELYQHHLQLVPSDKKAWYFLGRLYLSQGQDQAAKNAFKKADIKQ